MSPSKTPVNTVFIRETKEEEKERVFFKCALMDVKLNRENVRWVKNVIMGSPKGKIPVLVARDKNDPKDKWFWVYFEELIKVEGEDNTNRKPYK